MPATDAISTREAEVLALLGEHLSNAEIAARLYISVRTVESHVSALLRKLGAADRRALARHAAPARPQAAAPSLPTPLTSFVGRSRERRELAEAVTTHRQVTALGPGGVGKTRLALAVAADVAGEFDDGVWFVDLVPVTDGDQVAAAVADALGVGEQPGRDIEESVAAALSDHRALLVLDNCEQVRDGVARFVERLLTVCPAVTVLATSRARLMVPFERAYPVPPLSLGAEAGSDAVRLFVERAAATGEPPAERTRADIAAICERLDGMALAIELAAARYPSLGLDGLTAALSHPLRMLTGGSRADERHRSVRAALDWSHALLGAEDRALLRRVSVFAAPFGVDAAARVSNLDGGAAAEGLARLAEQSLLVVTSSVDGTAYRVLETIRQYGTERLAEADELAATRARHLAWCLAQADALATRPADWRARFDAVADDLRAAVAWAETGSSAGQGDDPRPTSTPASERERRRVEPHDDATSDGDASASARPPGDGRPATSAASERGLRRVPTPGGSTTRSSSAALQGGGDGSTIVASVAQRQTSLRGDAARLAKGLAGLTFSRGLFTESQLRHERAAGLATDARDAAALLREAAAVAVCRMRGDDMFRLLLDAAEVSRRAGDADATARDLATAATHAHRFSGEFVRLPPREETVALLDEARGLAGDDPASAAAIALAEAGVLRDAFGSAQGPADNDAADTLAQAERAVELARRTGDPLAESAALDTVTGARSWGGDAFGVAATLRRRVELVEPLPESPQRTLELTDAMVQAIEAAIGIGDLEGARAWERRLAAQPLLAEVDYRATGWLLVTAALGDGIAEAPAIGERFLRSWRRAGGPTGSYLGPAAAAALLVARLRADASAQRQWGEVAGALTAQPGHEFSYRAVFDATHMLHTGRTEDAWRRLEPEPEAVWKSITWIWLHWYVAMRAEAAVLAGGAAAGRLIGEARAIVAGNPTAEALTERADALWRNDRERVLATATAFEAAGNGYQAARSLVLAGGAAGRRGQAALAGLGLTAMAPPD